jgi:hypothetical protein
MTETDEAAYSGVFGAFPYAFRASDSRLFRSYVVLGGLVAALVALLFVFAFVGIVADTLRGGGFATFSRAFVVVIGLFVVGPLIAPVLLVARRRRRTGDGGRYDPALALAGYLFLASLYVGLVISTPEAQQQSVSGALAPVVSFLYGLPRIAGLVPPMVAAGVIYVAHRAFR